MSNHNKQPTTTRAYQKYGRERRLITDHKPNYVARRIGAGLLATGLIVGGAVRAGEAGDTDVNIDRTVVAGLSPAERDAQYVRYVIDPEAKPDEQGVAPDIWGIAQEYKDTYHLEGDVRRIVDELEEQVGENETIQPGKDFYLPRLDNQDQD